MIILLEVYKTICQSDKQKILHVLIVKSKSSNNFLKSVIPSYSKASKTLELAEKVFKVNFIVQKITCRIQNVEYTVYEPKNDSCNFLRTTNIIRVEESDRSALVPAIKFSLKDIENCQSKVFVVGGRNFSIHTRSILWDEKMEAILKGMQYTIFAILPTMKSPLF